ncbi:conserved hypothetical protein [Verticillium alfalfae VaMs.102]|uniref:DUF7730 domain-containing protein n=1 Tax=Verticillium alfalfae (strain VaMs.102 / ATCC MYA-4576 / FGSC 10136) TaxID=526221 RepID=C9SHR3_VERA1|nr:conserved hypothetical protein [Verticillium alfalfae VaMs.102]EEY18486.1 conserved hypothetical protein [Verticillium alfalfae VaMs.102]
MRRTQRHSCRCFVAREPVSSHHEPPSQAAHQPQPSSAISPLTFAARYSCTHFGAQTIHIDLVYDRPRIQGKAPSTHAHRHRRAPRPTLAQRKAAPAMHALRSKRWRWYSCVCHSDLPCGTQSWSRFAEPCDDACSDFGSCCSEWPGEAPSKCSIGIMGWLLTCRQAYTEGLDVLWGTNTLRVEDMVILRHAQDLFLAHRWAKLPHLELRWAFSVFWVWPASFQTDPLQLYADHAGFHSLLDHLPLVLGSLQTLYISFEGTGKWHPGRPPETVLEKVLAPVEAMLRQLPATTLRECTVALPSSAYQVARNEAVLAGCTVGYYCRRQKERYWRALPEPTAGLKLKGYWVQLGKIDMHLPIAWPCFGTGAGWSWRDDFDIPDEDCILYGMKSW